MAAGAAVQVCVVEGTCTKITETSLSVSLTVELQCQGLCIDTSLWTACLSNGGYLVSLFGPL